MLPAAGRQINGRRCAPAVALIALLFAGAAAAVAAAPETATLFLSGTGYGDTVDWEFFCTAGRRCGRWTTIPVPSQWELQGFGNYNYGHDDKKFAETGRYRHRFRLPADWRGSTVDLVFEGVMTDAEVRLNGHRAGPVHRGAFYRFRYDVSDLLDWRGENLLEVEVRKQSSDASVNLAERDADYWVFGGIFRPVYLEASPPESIAHLDVDARHDGALRLRVRLRGSAASAGGRRPCRLEARIYSGAGAAVGEPFAAAAEGCRGQVELATRVAGIRPWSAESPDLYRLHVELRRDGVLLHRRDQRFGFRTVRVAGAEGLYVNERRVLLKGVDRHAFWPASGRTLNRRIDRRDAELIKSMNMNAVRTAHYPPDESFLDACDELGLYVLDELAGWHDAYATGVGRHLVREMVERDARHPSILFWDNGNEGGWNAALDREFGASDLQGRAVLRPGAVAAGVDARHYPTYEELAEALGSRPLIRRWRRSAPPLVLPTELLHGLYDGGSGAALADYWRLMRSSRRAAGGFLWAFTDEAVVRTDRGRELDTDGNHAPDGILGPYRELSGSYYAVREVFSPVALARGELGEDFDGTLEVENRYDMTDLSAVRFRWAWLTLPAPDDEPALAELAAGELAGPAVAPGRRGRLRVPPPASAEADALRLTALDSQGREILKWVLPRWGRRRLVAGMVEEGAGTVRATADGGRLTLTAGPVAAVFDAATGSLAALTRDGRRLALAGPRPAPEEAAPVASFHHRRDGSGHVVEVRYRRGLEMVRWKLFPSGWLRMTYLLSVRGRRDYFGVAFPLAAGDVRSFEWLGRGPARVWRNRREGGVLGVWRKVRGDETASRWAHEPKLAGYYAGVYWAKLHLASATLTLVVASDLDLGILEPRFPDDAHDAVAAVPRQGLAILNAIAPIGTKFHPPADLGPEGRPRAADGLYGGTVWMRLSR